MVAPRQVSRTELDEFGGVRWNAMVHICGLSELHDLSPIQRVAHLVFWYDSEVLNGGHDQYFGNREYFDQNAVIQALHTVGAFEQAKILAEALEEESKRQESEPEATDQAFAEDDYPFAEFDEATRACATPVVNYLERYLDRHEREFIEWIP